MTCHNCRIDAPKALENTRNGLQRYRCSAVRVRPLQNHTKSASRLKTTNKLTIPRRALSASGCLLKATAFARRHRITGLALTGRSFRSPVNSLASAVKRCSALKDSQRTGDAMSSADEIWTFVGKKQGHQRGNEDNFTEIGDAWIFVGIERTHEVSSRVRTWVTVASRVRLASCTRSRPRYRSGSKSFNSQPMDSPFIRLAVGNVLGHQGERVDYAQFIKIYAHGRSRERAALQSALAWLKRSPRLSTVTPMRRLFAQVTLNGRI